MCWCALHVLLLAGIMSVHAYRSHQHATYLCVRNQLSCRDIHATMCISWLLPHGHEHSMELDAYGSHRGGIHWQADVQQRCSLVCYSRLQADVLDSHVAL